MFFVVFVSVIFGAFCMLLMQMFLVFLYYKNQQVQPIPQRAQYEKAKMPEDLDISSLLHKTESCSALNVLIAFLFQELKDAAFVRRWVVRKMNVEFEELLTAKTAGKILEQINVQDYCLGTSFPTIKSVTLMKCLQDDPSEVPDEIDIAADLEYSGGFRVSVDVDLVFGTTAYVSITVTKLKGRLRLQFSRNPFTHWSMSFYDEPEVEFEVESHFEGRSVPKLGSLIVGQLRKTLRKKHTLPNYKMRYQPFFVKPAPPHSSADVYVHDGKITTGKLAVTVVECSRLSVSPAQKGLSEIYCTLSVNPEPWNQEDIVRRFPGETFEVDLPKGGPRVGLKFTTGCRESDVVIASINRDSPAGQTELKKGDLLQAVDGIRVTNAKHAAKLIKQTKDRCILKVQRPAHPIVTQTDGQTMTDGSGKNIEIVDVQLDDNDYEDFINVKMMQTLGVSADEVDLIAQTTSAPGKLQVPATDSPVLRRRTGNLDSTEGDAPVRRLSSSLDYSTLRNLSTTMDRENRLQSIKMLFKESMQAKPGDKKRKKTVKNPTIASLQAGGDTDTQEIDPDRVSLSSLTSLVDEPDMAGSPNTGSTVTGSTVSIAGGDQAAVSEPANSEFSGYDDLYETSLVPAYDEPTWDETFNFEVDEFDRYLNVCVWNRIPLSSGSKDILIGYTCVPLMDVALQCLNTKAGEHLLVSNLHPPEQRAGATRLPGQSHLYQHSGFETRLCYGDVALFFQHTPSGEQPPTKEELEMTESLLKELQSKHKAVAEERWKTLNKVKGHKHTRPDELNLFPGLQHRFVGTHFTVPTRCDFCSKKVWTKYALKCQVCQLICHKKCSEKTQAQIPCDRTKVWRKPDQSSPSKDQQLNVKVVADPSASPQTTPTMQRRSGVSPQPSPVPSPDPSPRESSASSDEDEEDEVNVAVRGLNRLKRDLRELARAEGNRVDDTDAVFMTAARELGRELFIELPNNERKEKLETMVNKLQREIDAEVERQLQLTQDIQTDQHRPQQRLGTQQQHQQQQQQQRRQRRRTGNMCRSEERMQMLATLMLHYCAGIQHCNETLHTAEELDNKVNENGNVDPQP
ncbi:PDZ domain-containing protein 8-like [Patiria miniata]|uniref:PDZ domain-containing protein 8 n=1 Tax=Patiria miniata TaxID=46514 RepID=A0A913ZUD0_PATMI|nr:PDZ domain-containing protein 8-like [Patiria miniata]XP_038055319.1 PDZ domain-containing protein 8-like [Patiria miniata]